MSHQFRRHPEDMNNPRIQKISRHGNEKNYSKSPMSSNDNYIKNETTVTSNDVSNGKIYEPSNDRYVLLITLNLVVILKRISCMKTSLIL